VHKMDLVPPSERAAVFAAREALLRARTPTSLRPQFFATSIWDETLYQAWSMVVHSLVPNIAVLDAALADLAEGAGADEVVLFERASLLVISSHTRARHADRHRFEKVSNLVKRFKLMCGKGQGQLVGLACGNGSVRAVLDAFTSHTYVLVVVGVGGGGQGGRSSAAAHPGGGDAAQHCAGPGDL
jgi:Ras-related GTP-binding protein A/B